MSDDATQRWRHPIADEELTADLLPAPGAPWSQLVYFAGTLNGYETVGGGVGELMDAANPARQRFQERGELPGDVHTLVEAIRARVAE